MTREREHPLSLSFLFFKKTIDKVSFLCYNKIKEREVMKNENKMDLCQLKLGVRCRL